ncbi:MAG: amino acid adenylation domain-containing protein [Ferruginibacter sp.]
MALNCAKKKKNMTSIRFPLHPAQYDIFIDQLIDIDKPHYNIGLYIKLQGHLSKQKFHEAVNSSPGEFDAFKMRFDWDDADGICYFDDYYERLEMVDMDFSNRDSPEKEAQSWMQNQFNVPFILQKESLLFEHVLIKISNDEHWFFFRYHHIVTDAFGLTVWVNYIARKYKSLVEGNNFTFTYPSFKDEAIKSSQYRTSVSYALDGNYWKDKIGEKPDTLLRKNTSIATKLVMKTGNYYLNISREQKIILDEVLLVTKSNLHQLTIAALLIYFGKISAQQEIIFGIPVHKRGLGDALQNIVGMFSGVLPFKSVYDEKIKLKDLLKNIAGSRKADYPHQNYLIIDLVKSLKINASDSFLYDVIINNVPFNFDLDFGAGIHPTIQWLQSEYEKLPLQVVWRDYGNQQPLELALHYSYEHFTTEEIELLAQRIIFILEQFPAALDTNIGNIKIVPPKEQQLLNEFEGKAVAYHRKQSIVNLFERQAESTPNDIALVFKDQHLSYKELNEQSNQLAHYLTSKGVKEEVLIPVCIERSIEMIVGIMGILKAGAAYVPLDPDYPQERINYMLLDTGASIVVSSKAGRSRLPFHENREVVELDTNWSNISHHKKDNLLTSPSPEHLAYIIYTSGSTGTPKGVMIEHKGLAASTLARKSYYQSFGSVFLIPSFSFDSSVAVIFGTLITGGSLVLCENQHIKDANAVRGILKNVDTIFCVPSYYRLLLEERIVEDSLLSKVILGGEDLDEQLVTRHFTETNNILLYNEYGPTEYTVWATVAKIENPNKVTIGAPINNTSIYIVGKEGGINPIGVAGEICIAGDGLARGYLNNEELSKQKFVANPFSSEDGARMYKTGDLGRWLPEGNIEFIGRADNQVKIRGYRIELGEVENVLRQCEQVNQALVLAHQQNVDGKQLVGYIVPQEGELDREALIHYLSSKLPQYMIPGLWIELKQLPLTSNGKIDRKALPDVSANEALHQQYKAPHNEVEKKLSIIWQDVLKVDQVGIHHNFFELGGDSIKSIQIVSRAKRLGYPIQSKDLFLYQTIEKLSRAIIGQSAAGAMGGPNLNEYAQNPSKKVLQSSNDFKYLIPARIGGSKMPLYIICGGGGTVFKFKKFIELLDANQPVYVLQQPSDVKDLAEFPNEITGIAARYVAEILLHNPNGPYALSGHCIGGIVAFEMSKQMQAKGKKVSLLVMFDTIIDEANGEKCQPLALMSLNYKSNIVTQFFLRIFIKTQFETFLLRKHTKHAIKYKINSIKSFIRNVIPNEANKKKNGELEIYAELGNAFKTAYSNYVLTPYNNDIIVFYAKDHYYFSDKDKNINYRKSILNDSVKDRWKSYVRQATFYEIEGEHSTMFDQEHGGRELARKLQEHLDNCCN